MFQVAVRRLAPKRWHHHNLVEGNRFTGPSHFRLISSFEPANSIQPRKKYHAIQLGSCRINYSNFQIIHGGNSRSFPFLHHQRRWFNDEKPPPLKKAQEEPGRLSQIVRFRIVVGYIKRTSVRDSHSLTDARAIKPNEKVGQYVRGN